MKKLFNIILLLSMQSLIILLCAQQTSIEIDKPDLSHKRGFYDSSFILRITSNYVGAKIVFTLDGSDPFTSPTALTNDAPCQVVIDPASTANRGGKTPGVHIRVFALAEGLDSSEIVTHTYLFTDAIIAQTDPGGHWNNKQATYTWPGYDAPQSIDYDMDEKITRDPKYAEDMADALKLIPSVSLVTNYDDMFDPDKGIFMNALTLGLECPASIEWIDPEKDEDFQIDGGVRMRGRYSRLPRNPKHSFRLFFRKAYGEAKLDYDLFGNSATDEFDHLDLRTAQNSSWNAENGWEHTVTFLKEISSRDMQRQLGMLNTRSIYCHLYLNGIYYGLFQIQERADDHFAESYIGGDKSDYDIIKPQQNVTDPPNDLLIGASAGTMEAAQLLWDAMLRGFEEDSAYFAVQGLDTLGQQVPGLIPLLDVENLIDYLLVPFYMGSKDGPGVKWEDLWGHVTRPNNFIGMYNRNNPDGFKWIVHDFEKAMYNRNDNWPLVDDDSWFSEDFEMFNPLTIHRALMKNDEYLVTFNDRVHKHYLADGVFTKENVRNIFLKRRAQIELPVLAESARWGDWISWRAVQTPAHWSENVDFLLDDYIPYRTNIVLGQFEGLGLYSNLKSPLFMLGEEKLGTNWSELDPGSSIRIIDPNTSEGQIYITLDGSDPRSIGGEAGETAEQISNNAILAINENTSIKARILQGGTWSSLSETKLAIRQSYDALLLTEIHYNPLPLDTLDGDKFEFIELKNSGTETLSLTALKFTSGIDYIFPETSLEAGGYIVLASDTAAFRMRYRMSADGQYKGRLRNSGERICLKTPGGTELIALEYLDDEPWPEAADGSGNSLVINTDESNEFIWDPNYWRTSTYIGGSPGKDDPVLTTARVRINEVLSNTEFPKVDRIELYNPSDAPVNISNWFLTDERSRPAKWQIPEGSEIPGKSYISFNAGHYTDEKLSYDAHEFGSAFHISSLGESLFLFEADADSVLLGYSHGVVVPAVESDISCGFHMNSLGHEFFIPLAEHTFGEQNSGPRLGPLLISEIMYHPDSGNYEYVKLQNISDDFVDLYQEENWKGYRLNGIDFRARSNIELAPGDSIYVIEKEVSEEEFRQMYWLNEETKVTWMQGSLDNGGETLELEMPGEQYIENSFIYDPMYHVEEVSFLDHIPWYPLTDGHGYALRRNPDWGFANDPVSWFAAIPEQPLVSTFERQYDWLKLYPNPVSSILHLESGSDISNALVEIHDVSGRLVYTDELPGPTFSIDLSHFEPGIYMVSIRSAGKLTTASIIKK